MLLAVRPAAPETAARPTGSEAVVRATGAGTGTDGTTGAGLIVMGLTMRATGAELVIDPAAGNEG
jgi:hypothetical protein